jgi:hypothetical protein
MEPTQWDFVVQAYDANWGWITVVAGLLLLILILLGKMKNAPIDTEPEPLYPMAEQLRHSVDASLEEWGKLAEQDQQRKEADEALQRKVDEIVKAAWKSEDRA